MTWDDLDWWRSDTKEAIHGMILETRMSVLPHPDRWYRALELTPFESVKCVILGQDPYHTPGVANGLAFSVSPDVRTLPPSLRNIFKEYREDLGYPMPRNGDLTPWAQSGVLLLNTALTVQPNRPASHADIGWDVFTKEVISKLNEHRTNLVFILWGRHAQQYQSLIQIKRHHIIRSPHPSPFSASTGFFTSKPFSRTNEYLVSKRQEPVNWRL